MFACAFASNCNIASMGCCVNAENGIEHVNFSMVFDANVDASVNEALWKSLRA